MEGKELKYNVSLNEESVKAATNKIVEITKKLQEIKTLANELNSCISEIELEVNVKN